MKVEESVKGARRGAAIFRLPERGVIEVTGSDRERWLNGMVSNDVAALAPGPQHSGCYATQLTRQGRIVADFHILLRAESFWLETRADRIPQIIEGLDRFLIADDVQLIDLRAELERIGVEGPRSFDLLAEAGIALELEPGACAEVSLAGRELVVARFGWSGERALQLFCPTGSLDEVIVALEGAAERGGIECAEGPTQALEILRVEAGVPMLGDELDEEVLPDEAHLDHAISTTKGCYTGQEIVARIRSQGRVGHLLVALRFEAGAAPVGADLMAGGRRTGEVTSSVDSPSCGAIGMGFVRRADAAPGTQLEVDGHSAVVAEIPLVAPR